MTLGIMVQISMRASRTADPNGSFIILTRSTWGMSIPVEWTVAIFRTMPTAVLVPLRTPRQNRGTRHVGRSLRSLPHQRLAVHRFFNSFGFGDHQDGFGFAVAATRRMRRRIRSGVAIFGRKDRIPDENLGTRVGTMRPSRRR